MGEGVRYMVCLAALTCGLSSHPVSRASGSPSIRYGGVCPLADLPPEVRLRRLHLVRPDLIPYPIDIEVVC